jgi:hypothetical protein
MFIIKIYVKETTYEMHAKIVMSLKCKLLAAKLALRENFVDRPESYDSFSAKSYVFLAHGLEYISPFPYTICPKGRYKKIPMSFAYYICTITTLQSLTSLCHVTKHRNLEYGK